MEAGNRPRERAQPPVDKLAASSFWLFGLLVAGNLESTLLECGVGPCADNPIVHDGLQF